MIDTWKPPYPWFGGKSDVVDEIWSRFGDVRNFVDPFFGSMAMLFGRPEPWEGTETVNDLDGFLANFWRSVQADPAAVARHAARPVNENDMHAIHVRLKDGRSLLTSRLEGDPDYFDARIAGWWAWGQCCWIGSGWCAEGRQGPWSVVVDDEGARQLVHLGDAGQGVNRQLVHLGDAGQGVNRQLVHLGDAGQEAPSDSGEGSTANGSGGLVDYFAALSARLRRVRVCCGDWTRVCGPMPTVKLGLTAVFLDPPYCVDLNTEILTGRGWMHREQLLPDDEVLTLSHDGDCSSRWEPILGIHDFPAERRKMLSMESKAHSSLTTLDHRWPVRRWVRFSTGRKLASSWSTSAALGSADNIPVTAPHAGFPTTPIHSDALVELVAWFWTEGTLERLRNGEKSNYGNICQSTLVNPESCRRIGAAFVKEFGPQSDGFPRMGKAPDGIPRWRFSIDRHKSVWWFSSGLGAILALHAPGRVPTMKFLRSLTASQMSLFFDISIRADGWTTSKSGYTRTALTQKDRASAEAFQVAATLAGHSTSFRFDPIGNRWTVYVRTSRSIYVSKQKCCIVEHDGPVWCVSTPSKTWLARRNGTVWWTGNSDTAKRTSRLYSKDSLSVAHAVREWAIAHGDDPRLRICLAGYDGEHAMPDSWTCVSWKARGGYGSQSQTHDNPNARRERLWFSPHTIKPNDDMPLFAGMT